MMTIKLNFFFDENRKNNQIFFKLSKHLNFFYKKREKNDEIGTKFQDYSTGGNNLNLQTIVVVVVVVDHLIKIQCDKFDIWPWSVN